MEPVHGSSKVKEAEISETLRKVLFALSDIKNISVSCYAKFHPNSLLAIRSSIS